MFSSTMNRWGEWYNGCVPCILGFDGVYRDR